MKKKKISISVLIGRVFSDSGFLKDDSGDKSGKKREANTVFVPGSRRPPLRRSQCRRPPQSACSGLNVAIITKTKKT